MEIEMNDCVERLPWNVIVSAHSQANKNNKCEKFLLRKNVHI